MTVPAEVCPRSWAMRAGFGAHAWPLMTVTSAGLASGTAGSEGELHQPHPAILPRRRRHGRPEVSADARMADTLTPVTPFWRVFQAFEYQ